MIAVRVVQRRRAPRRQAHPRVTARGWLRVQARYVATHRMHCAGLVVVGAEIGLLLHLFGWVR